MHKGASGICRRILLSLAVLLACSASAQTSAPSIGALKELSVDELMDIEVTSVSKEPEKLSDAASAIQVVTNDEIERSGASSIPEALELAGNLDIAQKNSHDWAISARGFNTALGNKLLVLMDGRSVYTPLYSGVFWDVQDYLLEDIDRIEVISGPGGTLWGANAVNGVINVTTKSAKDTQGLYAEAGGGSELEGFAAVRYAANWGMTPTTGYTPSILTGPTRSSRAGPARRTHGTRRRRVFAWTRAARPRAASRCRGTSTADRRASPRAERQRCAATISWAGGPANSRTAPA